MKMEVRLNFKLTIFLKKYKKGALIVGRPLFTRELSKVVPPPTSYNINRELG